MGVVATLLIDDYLFLFFFEDLVLRFFLGDPTLLDAKAADMTSSVVSWSSEPESGVMRRFSSSTSVLALLYDVVAACGEPPSNGVRNASSSSALIIIAAEVTVKLTFTVALSRLLSTSCLALMTA